MSSEISVRDDVKELIDAIITKNNWKPVTEIKYFPGTEAGDGYASKHVGVEIISKKATHRLFVKYTLDIPPEISEKDRSVEKWYANEIYFYDVIYPAYSKFLKEKSVENGFRNAPKCYGTSIKNVIALENLKDIGFTLFDKSMAMNDEHISLVLKTFAKFHALSYAFKDQDRESYDKLEADANKQFMGAAFNDKGSPLMKMVRNSINDGLCKMDPEADKHILEKCNEDDLIEIVVGGQSYVNEYSIITQGDCWCNNMMFLYEKENIEHPVDIMLVDWQMARLASPVFDISYFFYTIANEEALNKLDVYLKEYYTELSNQIENFGSDPNQLYPFTVFQEEWKLLCKFGFAMAFLVFKIMLIKKEDVSKFEEIDYEEMMKSESVNFFPKFDNYPEYIRRLRVLGEFLVNKGYL